MVTLLIYLQLFLYGAGFYLNLFFYTQYNIIKKKDARLLSILLIIFMVVALSIHEQISIAIYSIYLLIEYIILKKSSRDLFSLFFILIQTLGTVLSIALTVDVFKVFLPKILVDLNVYTWLFFILTQVIIFYLYTKITFHLLKKFDLLEPNTDMYEGDLREFRGITTSILFLFFSIVFLHGYSVTQKRWFLSFYTLIILLSICFVLTAIIYYINLSKNKNREINLLSKYYLNEKEKSIETAKFRHDYKALLVSLKICLDMNELNEAQNLLQELNLETNQAFNSREYYSLLAVLDNIPVQGLLLNFFNKCEENDIRLKISPMKLPSTLMISNFELIRILSILLNNALEEVQHLTQKREIDVTVTQKDGKLIININNKFRKKISVKDIMKSGFTTKENHSGLGLDNIFQIAKKNKHIQFAISTNQDHFITTTTIDF